MAGVVRFLFGSFVLAILVSNVAAFGGRSGSWFGASGSSYHLAPPIYYYCPPATTVAPMAAPMPYVGSPWAAPTPAPPSRSAEPPLGDSRMPKIISRAGGAASKDLCRVGFWNLTGRDVMVTIEGKSWSLPKNQVLTFDMDREFTWQIAGHPQHVERIAAGKMAHEVIIRE